MTTAVRVRLSYPAGKCPACRHEDYYEDINWKPGDGLEPEMKKVYCPECDTAYYLVPIRRGNGHTVEETDIERRFL